MSKIDVLVVFGTRPEAIKMCPLVLELKKRDEFFNTMVCVTGQHREMLDQVLKVFNITPDFDLNIMKENQTLTSITNSVLASVDVLLKENNFDIILVHGDTTTTFAASLAAFYNQIKIGHVEAGLRTYNKYSPFPEEINREIVGLLADLNFAPTQQAKDNLLKEGKTAESIFVTGNTAIDALKTTIDKNYYNSIYDWIDEDKLILLTAHRRENLGQPMENMFKAINRILEENDGYKVIYPVHLNPRVQEVAKKLFENNDKVKLIEPLEVVDFHNLIAKSHIILTDSGGIQEEAPSLGKPVLVLRDTTERPEGVDAGTLKLVGTNEEIIYESLSELINDKVKYNEMSHASNPYGDGTASQQICDAIIDYFQTGNKKVIE